MFVRMNAPVCQFFIQLISTALQPGHGYHWSQDDAGQCWLSSAGVSENSHTWKQRLQFQLVEWVPSCWFDQFPNKYVLPRKVPSLNSHWKTFQSKLQHSISLQLVDITKHFQTLASLLWYILKLIYAVCMPTKSHCNQLLGLQAKLVSGCNLAHYITRSFSIC